MPTAFCPPRHNYDAHLQHWSSLSFEQYCQAHSELITTIRHHHQMDASAHSIQFNSPYCLMPDQGQQDHAVILIHGFTASPYYLHAIAKCYAQLGITSYSITLPGHGTCPGDLLNCHIRHWVNYVTLIFDKVSTQHSYIHLCGHSMGATIANLLSIEKPIGSLVELAPAHGIHPIDSLKIAMSHVITHGLRWQLWQQYRPEINQVAYCSTPVRACQQAVRLIGKLPPLPQCPIFSVASAEDATVAASKTYRRYQNTNNTTLYWYQRHPNIITNKRIHVVDSSILAEDIAELSHISLTIPESDHYLGRNGSYHQNKQVLWGELCGDFAKKINFTRLTFNPDFAHMLAALQHFVHTYI